MAPFSSWGLGACKWGDGDEQQPASVPLYFLSVEAMEPHSLLLMSPCLSCKYETYPPESSVKTRSFPLKFLLVEYFIIVETGKGTKIVTKEVLILERFLQTDVQLCPTELWSLYIHFPASALDISYLGLLSFLLKMGIPSISITFRWEDRTSQTLTYLRAFPSHLIMWAPPLINPFLPFSSYFPFFTLSSPYLLSFPSFFPLNKPSVEFICFASFQRTRW